MSGIEILIGDHQGIYIPQHFVEGFHAVGWGIKPEDVELLQKGPEAEYYWDTWDHILGSAEYKMNGQTWHLYQDGDLFAICDELMSDDEYKDFYGEPRDI